ncbi:MAG: hypothetical protein CVU77_04425 [Elusimicrobia bacterium HGW-Elusimicrobia-1]|jgi:hypothetical protein|nr:MAG: hypothetical protein CVU77_04425 [Elusimicrobia bacterium HGW-Elusimicrobia-1]
MKRTTAILMIIALTAAGCATAPSISRHKKPDFLKPDTAYLKAGDRDTRVHGIDSKKVARTKIEKEMLLLCSVMLSPLLIPYYALGGKDSLGPPPSLNFNDYIMVDPGARTVELSYYSTQPAVFGPVGSYTRITTGIISIEHIFEPGKLYTALSFTDSQFVRFIITEAELTQK